MSDNAGEVVQFRDEVPFALEELFFSRTNEAGIIVSGNSVFQRVSIYAWEDLLNQPHKIVRHPDTPRAIFWLLWDAIKRGQPIGAYIKNRAADGRSYWVYAIVTPVEGGFLSVRLKPSTPLSETIKQEYLTLSDAERRDTLKPEDSAKRLLTRLAELGFPDYPAFMTETLASEIVSRDTRLGRAPDPAMAAFAELSAAAQQLISHADEIVLAYERNAYVPLNFQVQAAQLGDAGASIGVISNNYNIISGEIKSNLDRFMASARSVLASIQSGHFSVSVARMQEEIAAVFDREPGEALASRAVDLMQLKQQQIAYRERALESLRAIDKQAEIFRDDCAQMGRLTAGLEVTRVMGKVESSRLAEAKEELNELIDLLEHFQQALAGGLKQINRMNQRIQHATHQLLWQAEAA